MCARVVLEMVLLFRALVFGLGTAVGSFLNVVVWRSLKRGSGQGDKKSQKKLDWLRGRSLCDHCGQQLKWWENIPIVSFLLLRGRCRTCHSPIPWEYLLVELGTGVVYLLTWKFAISSTNILLSIIYYLLSTILIAVFLFDLHYQIIPDWAVGGLIVLTFFLHLGGIWGNYLLTGLVSAAFFLFLHLITRGRGMGLGDVKFSFFIGFFLGFPKAVLGFYLAFLTGAVLGVILILLKKKKFGQQIAFGPFLVLATFVSWFWGEKMLEIFNFQFSIFK